MKVDQSLCCSRWSRWVALWPCQHVSRLPRMDPAHLREEWQCAGLNTESRGVYIQGGSLTRWLVPRTSPSHLNLKRMYGTSRSSTSSVSTQTSRIKYFCFGAMGVLVTDTTSSLIFIAMRCAATARFVMNEYRMATPQLIIDTSTSRRAWKRSMNSRRVTSPTSKSRRSHNVQRKLLHSRAMQGVGAAVTAIGCARLKNVFCSPAGASGRHNLMISRAAAAAATVAGGTMQGMMLWPMRRMARWSPGAIP
mmetsp:Transcript_51616/g.121123  ORF Transcript_51616/g.121123 Transcript_51616/m.121123 type:complete len:250 (-) Transcript_51616:1172-1921(-)